jgi:hypothetical protein
MEIKTRSFQMQINYSQIIVQTAIHHAPVQEEQPLQLKKKILPEGRVPAPRLSPRVASAAPRAPWQRLYRGAPSPSHGLETRGAESAPFMLWRGW